MNRQKSCCDNCQISVLQQRVCAANTEKSRFCQISKSSNMSESEKKEETAFYHFLFS